MSCKQAHLQDEVGLHAHAGRVVAIGLAAVAPVQVEGQRAGIGKRKQRVNRPEGTYHGVTQPHAAAAIPAAS